MIKTNKTIIFSLFYIAGLMSFFIAKISLVAGILFLLLLFLVHKKIISMRFSIVLLLIFVIAILNCHFRIKETDRLNTIAPVNTVITGRILTIPTTNNKDRTKFYLNVTKVENNNEFENIKNNKTIVTINDSPENLAKLQIGDTVKIAGRLALPRQGVNPNQFDYARYLRNFNTFTLFYANNGNCEILSNADTLFWRFLQNLNKIRSNLVEKHKVNLKSPNIEVLGGIIFGDDAVNPPDEVRTSFINSGLLHILAASGMNVTLIFGIWFFIARKTKLHYKLSIITGMVLIIVYTCMTGFGPPILRATLMLLFILFGKLINRNSDNIALLFFVAFLLMLYDPAMINNIGFQLSFVVTFGLLYTCPIFLDKIDNKIINAVASACLVPVIAQIYAAPIQMYYFNTFATYSIIANILIVPVLGLVSFTGFISSILALIPKVSTYICLGADFILNPFLSFIVNVSFFFSKMKSALLYTKQIIPLQVVFYYLFVLSTTIFIKDRLNNKKFLIVSVALFIAMLLFLIPIPNKDCEIIFFSVGNADATLIKTPKNKYVLIDSGKLPYMNSASQAEQIILKHLSSKGVKQLDSYIITHFDSDHAGGSIPVLSKLKIDKTYTSRYSDDTKLYKTITSYFEDNNTNIKIVENDMIVVEDNGFKLTNLYTDTKTGKDNDNSIVTLLENQGFKVLFMADADKNSFKTLNKEILSKIDILKVGHHGGKNAVDDNMLSFLAPSVAVISTGINPYGHPDKSTLSTIKQHNIKLFRTDYNNAVKVKIKKNEAVLYTYISKDKKFKKAFKITKKSP